MKRIKRGNCFIRNGLEYILAQVGTKKFSLICLDNGNRWNDPIETINSDSFTDKEWQQIAGCDFNLFTPIKRNPYYSKNNDLLEEHKNWASLFGEALLLSLQKDYSAIDNLAHNLEITIAEGKPILYSKFLERSKKWKSKT